MIKINIAIVLAGGTGTRIGAKIPKQFIKVLGKPIIIYTLEAIEQNQMIDQIVLVCVKSHMDLAKEYCEKYQIRKAKTFIGGGIDFTSSCYNGMNALRGTCSPEDIVMITSADRPFITQEEINDSIIVCRKHGSGVAAGPCARCMFMAEGSREHSSNYQRDELIETATPWSFGYGKLMNALDLFKSGELPACESYPVAIYVAAGNEAYFSKKDPNNIKITEQVDLAIMEQVLKERVQDECTKV